MRVGHSKYGRSEGEDKAAESVYIGSNKQQQIVWIIFKHNGNTLRCF